MGEREYTTQGVKEIKVIPLDRKKDSAGQQAQKKRRKADWTESEVIGVDMMGNLTFKQWAVVTAVIVGVFAGLFLGAFWTA